MWSRVSDRSASGDTDEASHNAAYRIKHLVVETHSIAVSNNTVTTTEKVLDS